MGVAINAVFPSGRHDFVFTSLTVLVVHVIKSLYVIITITITIIIITVIIIIIVIIIIMVASVGVIARKIWGMEWLASIRKVFRYS